jgi:hypothetical protein
MTNIPVNITNSVAVIPFTIHSQVSVTNRFGRDLLAEGWTIVPATRHNFLVLTDWCKEHVANDEFGYNKIVRAFVFKNVADAVQFKLACLTA